MDITMCLQDDCPVASTCYRHEAKPSKWQYFFSSDPREQDGDCHYYWQMNVSGN